MPSHDTLQSGNEIKHYRARPVFRYTSLANIFEMFRHIHVASSHYLPNLERNIS